MLATVIYADGWADDQDITGRAICRVLIGSIDAASKRSTQTPSRNMLLIAARNGGP